MIRRGVRSAFLAPFSAERFQVRLCTSTMGEMRKTEREKLRVPKRRGQEQRGDDGLGPWISLSLSLAFAQWDEREKEQGTSYTSTTRDKGPWKKGWQRCPCEEGVGTAPKEAENRIYLTATNLNLSYLLRKISGSHTSPKVNMTHHKGYSSYCITKIIPLEVMMDENYFVRC